MQLYELSVAEIVAGLRRREFSPVELLRALLQRIQALEPGIQAWETLDAERALESAALREQQLVEGDSRPLLGVPFGVKDIIFTSGLRTSMGSSNFADFVPTYDATAVARLKAAGAILLGKTVTVQFAFTDPARTRNPWDLSRSPGGSSSGSAAAVAARMVPAALGSQTGGSTIRPAAYCGVVGLKPSFGRVGRHGVMPLCWSIDDVGMIARTVEDVALLLQTLAGPHPGDATASPRPAGDYLLRSDLDSRRPRLGLLVDLLDRVEPVVRGHVMGVARRLEAAGAEIREIDPSLDMPLLFAVQGVLLASEAATVHGDLLAAHPEGYAPRLRSFVEIGQFVPAAAYVKAQRLRRRLRGQVEALFEGVDCFILPALACPAPSFGSDGDASLQLPWTLLGLPALSLPTGLSPEGLPLAIQLVARHFREEELLASARWCRQVLGAFPAPKVSMPDRG